VYRAWDHTGHRRVVLKLLDPNLQGDVHHRNAARLRREGDILERLWTAGCRHIPRFYGTYRHRAHPFLVAMEFIAGCTLTEATQARHSSGLPWTPGWTVRAPATARRAAAWSER